MTSVSKEVGLKAAWNGQPGPLAGQTSLGHLSEGVNMAKQCPNCRTISSASEAACGSCGFQFFNPGRSATSFPMLCMRIGGSVFLLACAALVLARLLA